MAALASRLVTKLKMMSLKAVAKPSGAAEPWTSLGISWSRAKSSIEDCRYTSNLLRSQSRRAQMEPFLGLKAS